MIQREDLSIIGKFQRTHALKGELNALLDIDPEFFEGDPFVIVEIDGIFVPFRVESLRRKGTQSYLVTLQGVENEPEAKIFVNKDIFARRHEVKFFDSHEGEEGEYADDLIGYTLRDAGGFSGVIRDIDLTTANPLFLVDNGSGGTVMIPIADEFILSVDPEKKILLTDLPEGLVDLN